MMDDIRRHAPIPQYPHHHHRRCRQHQQRPSFSTVLVTGNHSKCHSRRERGWAPRWRSILFLSLGTGQTPPHHHCSVRSQGRAEKGLSSCSCQPAETPRMGPHQLHSPQTNQSFFSSSAYMFRYIKIRTL